MRRAWEKVVACVGVDTILLGQKRNVTCLSDRVATKVDNVDMNELRNLGDKLKGEIGSGVVLVVSALAADKVNMIAMATDDVVAKGAHAGNLIKSVASLVGGGGGGRPNMAQAGGKNASGIDELLKKAPEVLAEQL